VKGFGGISGRFSLEKLLFKEKFNCLRIAFLEKKGSCAGRRRIDLSSSTSAIGRPNSLAILKKN
jgi:hypothetical protein